METTRKANGATGSLSASWRPSSLNEEARTVEVEFSHGSDVDRQDPWTGRRYTERLIVDAESVNLERLNEGAPLLDSHDRTSVRNQIGVVESARVEGGVGRAVIRFASDPDSDLIFSKVAEGIARQISVGYAPTETLVTEREGAPDLHEVVQWMPFELSVVSIGADSRAQVRSRNSPTETVRNGETNMEEKRDAPAPAPSVTLEERRLDFITTQCTRHGLPDLARELIADKAPMATASERIIAALGKRSDESEIDHRIEPSTGQRERSFAKVAGDAILHRERVEDSKNPDALAWSSRSLLEIARRCCEMDGVGIHSTTSNFELAKRALISSTTLADTIAHTAGRSLSIGYEAVPRVFTEIFRERSAQNFRPLETIKLSDIPSLPLVAEGAAYVETTLSDQKESYTLASHGSVIALTRQLLVNDDVDSLARVPMILGNAAARRENALMWGVLNDNGNMVDTNPIFAAGTNNLTVGGLTAAVLEAVRADMLGQTSENSLPLGLQPRWLVVGTDLLKDAEKLVRPPVDYSTSTLANTLSSQLANQMQLRYEPLIPTGTFYVFSDFRQLDSCEYAYLAGQPGVYLERDIEFTTGGLNLKATLDYGAAAIDRRTLHRVNAT